MPTVCKSCTSAYVEEKAGNCLLWVGGWKEYRDLGSNHSAAAYYHTLETILYDCHSLPL